MIAVFTDALKIRAWARQTVNSWVRHNKEIFICPTKFSVQAFLLLLQPQLFLSEHVNYSAESKSPEKT